jgi:DtxR family transcriptional regulator, manganese transport regulator
MRRSTPAFKLPERSVQALRSGKARIARRAALLEDYGELIADPLVADGEARSPDIAARLGVSGTATTKTIGRLKRQGLVTSRQYRGLSLTKAGSALAERVHTRHRLVVDLLFAVGAPVEVAESDAERIKHHVSDETLEAFARFLRLRA